MIFYFVALNEYFFQPVCFDRLSQLIAQQKTEARRLHHPGRVSDNFSCSVKYKLQSINLISTDG